MRGMREGAPPLLSTHSDWIQPGPHLSFSAVGIPSCPCAAWCHESFYGNLDPIVMDRLGCDNSGLAVLGMPYASKFLPTLLSTLRLYITPECLERPFTSHGPP